MIININNIYLAKVIYCSKHNINSNMFNKDFINGYKNILKTNKGDFPDFTKGYKKIKIGSIALVLTVESNEFSFCFIDSNFLYLPTSSLLKL